MSIRTIALGFLTSLAMAAPLLAADSATVSLAGTRTQFLTAEPVELAVLYKNDGGNAKSVTIEVRHADGTNVTIDVPVTAAAGAAASRLVTLNAGSLKPGAYTAQAAGAPAEAAVKFQVNPAENKNAYFTGQWVHYGGTYDNALAKGGWMYMTTDYVSMHPRKPAPGDVAEGYVANAMKPYALMVCGGGHQLDLDLPNDWGDPWVQRAVAWRVQLAALSDRIYPVGGLHLYDEPGLTWWPVSGPDGKTIGTSPFTIPHQIDEFKRLTGKEMPFGTFEQTLPKYAGMMPDWLAFMELRMKYLEQCWYASMWGVKSVEPRFTVVNQVSSSYAPHDITDGVDSRQNRPYEILSGHGQYSDLPFGTLQPLRAAESYQGFTWDRPHVYLPMWYTHTWATIRAAVWVSWASKLEGMLYTPEQNFALDNKNFGYFGSDSVFEIAEINRRLAMVGGVMSQLRKSLAPVAVLQSHTQASWDIATMNSPEVIKVGTPPYVSTHRDAVNACFFRVLETGMIPNTIDEVEVVEKGVEFLKQWKAVFCPALTYVTPAFRKALEGYVAAGGKLIQFKGDKLQIPGATQAEHTFSSGTDYWMTQIKVHQDAAVAAKKADDAATEAKESAIATAAGTDLAWRKWNNAGAPTFAADLAGWLGPQPCRSANPEVLLGVHSAGEGPFGATYLLLANNAQSKENPRLIKHELIPAETTVTLPAGGVVYDLFNGGAVTVKDGAFPVRLPAGDGACFLLLPAAPGKLKLAADLEKGNRLAVSIEWGTVGYLPFRLRVFDPAGNTITDLYRATTPDAIGTVKRTVTVRTRFKDTVPLGLNAAPGRWTVRVDEWLTGTKTEETVSVSNVRVAPALATAATDKVSIYFDDARRIVDLFAGKASEPEWPRLNWDAKRVFGFDAKRFALFAADADKPAAETLATALRAKGMTVEVNPAYAIKPFVREPNRGGAGPQFREGNFENIYANAIILPGHPLAKQSWERGHINRPVTAAFPGPGRAYIQWGMSCYQMGFQDMFVFGDTSAGVEWLLAALAGKAPAGETQSLKASVVPPTAPAAKAPAQFALKQEVRLADTPVGVATTADGSRLFVATYDGAVTAYDSTGKQLWRQQVLLEAGALALSPKGDRVAVGGFPGLVVLNAADGSAVAEFKAAPLVCGAWSLINRIVTVAWNDAGTRVAAGWINEKEQNLFVAEPATKKILMPAGITGNIYGVAFVPGGDTLLVGADKLTAVNAADGAVLWSNAIAGAQAFAFSADGKSAAAGGWGRNAGVFQVADGVVAKPVATEAVIGGVALTPAGDLVLAVWGGTKPLSVLKAAGDKPETLFQSRFAFQSVLWSEKLGGLVAAEQGGRLWLLGADGSVKATLDEEAGTTVYRIAEHQGQVVVGRMNRCVQRLTLK